MFTSLSPTHKRGTRSSRDRRGLTRIEFVVVSVLLMIGLGVVPSCTHTMRGDGSRTQCTNNLKQNGLGLHNFDGTFRRQPPLFGGGTDPSGKPVQVLSSKFPRINGAPHVFILPYIEQDNLYKAMRLPHEGSIYVPGPKQAQQVVPTYVCPADPSMADGIQEGSGLGGSSYVVNGQMFGTTDNLTGLPSAKDPWDRGVKIADIKDGSSNTILAAHSYARCGGTKGTATTPASGAVWGYYNGGHAPVGTEGPPIFMFAPISGNANVGSGITKAFQVSPRPPSAAATGTRGCDPGMPATPHTAMMVLLGDASVRSVTTELPVRVWWLACSPDDGAKMPSEW